MFWEYFGQALTLLTALFGVVTYVLDKIIARNHRTIEKIGELLEEYHDKYANMDIKQDYKQHVRFLSRIEQFCIAVDSHVYSKKTLKKYGSKFLISMYGKYADNVIAKRRSQFGNDNYRYLEKTVKWLGKEKEL